jgi:hypothetical protein
MTLPLLCGAEDNFTEDFQLVRNLGQPTRAGVRSEPAFSFVFSFSGFGRLGIGLVVLSSTQTACPWCRRTFICL